MGRQHKVIVKVNSTRRYFIDLDNRDYIIFIESISADGITYALIFVFKVSSLFEKWVVDKFNDNTAFIYSETGYLNNNINLI
jgi:hypothetical protein